MKWTSQLKIAAWGASIVLSGPLVARADAPSSPVVRVLEEELARSMKELALPGMPKPYFIAYRFVDSSGVSAHARFGALVNESKGRARFLAVEVRVGDYNLDNGNFASSGDGAGAMPHGLPLDDDEAVIRREAWSATDRAYKAALDELEKKKAHRNTQTADAAQAASFTQEKPVVSDEMAPPSAPDGTAFPALARKLSAIFREFPSVQADQVRLSADSSLRILLTSEGTRVASSRSSASFHASCTAQADDGMKLSHAIDLRARDVAGLPAETALVAAVRRLAEEIERARAAPTLSGDVQGPVLFDGLAAPVVFRDLLGRDLSGTPNMESENAAMQRMGEEHRLHGKIGQRILPKGFRLEDDPTVDMFGKSPLLGGYKFDDEGVPAQKVVLTEDGVLKTLLMSRVPAKEIAKSNGHASVTLTGNSFGGIANLILTAPGGLGPAELRRKLVAQIRESGADHGYIVSAFNAPFFFDPEDFDASRPRGPRPLLLVEVDRNGKERAVRGGSLPSLELRLLKDVVAVGKEPVVRHGDIGGRLTWMRGGPTGRGDLGSMIVPPLLFKEMEIKKSVGPEPKKPVMAHPFFAGKTR